MPLTKPLFDRFVAFLLPHMNDPGSRRALIESVLYGCEVLSLINWEGSAKEFTVHLVATLNRFGRCDTSGFALALVVQAIPAGLDKQAEVNDLIHLLNEPEPPEAESRTSMQSRSRLNEPWAIIIGAVITGIFTLAAVLLSRQTPAPAPTSTDTPPATLADATFTTNPTLNASQTNEPVAAATATAPDASQTPQPTLTSTNALPSATIPAIEASTPPSSMSTANLTVYRTGDSLAVCTAQTMDLAPLEVSFSAQERYRFASVFPDSASAAAESCWCLQQRDPQFPLHSNCTTVRQVSRVGDWRNAPVTVRLNGSPLGECAAQPSRLDEYSCDIALNP